MAGSTSTSCMRPLTFSVIRLIAGRIHPGSGSGIGIRRPVRCRGPGLLAGGDALFDLGDCGDDNVADHLEAFRVDVLEVVLWCVPRRVLEIDDVGRGDARAQEWNVVVLDYGQLIREGAGVPQARGGGP